MKELDNNFIKAFAAQYWNQEVVKMASYDDLMNPYDGIRMVYKYKCRIEYIELRSIDDLTDEECVKLEFANKEHFDIWIDSYKYIPVENMFDIDQIDYLRSIGIAVSFRSVSVETMILSGKLKLRKS